MDYERLASELVRKLRGARSQPAISRRLGYQANVVYLWESGRRFPPASSLFRLASRSQLEPALLAPGTAASELARGAGVDRSTVARWLAGRTEPRLPVWLKLVDKVAHRL